MLVFQASNMMTFPGEHLMTLHDNPMSIIIIITML